jgi:TolB protein
LVLSSPGAVNCRLVEGFIVTIRRIVLIGLCLSVVALPLVLTRPPAPRAQGVDVFLNVTGGGAKKLNIAIPELTLVSGTDSAGAAKSVASIIGADLTFSGLFQVATATGPPPRNNPEALRKLWSDFAAAGAHAGLHGLLTVRGDRLEVEARLYDLTSPDQRAIAAKKFDLSSAQMRRLAHLIADDVVLQFTGQPGIADTKVAFTRVTGTAKEIYVADYDGASPAPVTRNGSVNLSPAWSPDVRSVAFTSFSRGYPDLYRAFPFERRPEQVLAAFQGINTSPSFSPDGQRVALTLSKDGNPEIYVLTLGTGAFQRLTRHPAIDTEPNWSPDGRQLVFISDRGGAPRLFVMDTEGGSLRQLTNGGHHTQPRWSPRGDVIAFTARAGGFHIWAVNADGTNARKLTEAGDNQSATWSPDGRHLAFQTSRLGGWQIFAMFPDGSQQAPLIRGGTDTSPSWSSRLP